MLYSPFCIPQFGCNIDHHGIFFVFFILEATIVSQENWGHLCLMDTFLVFMRYHIKHCFYIFVTFRLYPVDKKRVNEYGQSFDDAVTEKPKKE